MTQRHDGPGVPTAADYDVGGDADEPGLSQPITLDDIEALAHSARGSAKERRRALTGIVNELEVRRSMDVSGELDPLLARGRELLATLSRESAGEGGPEGFGWAPEDRPQRPDEILERDDLAGAEGDGDEKRFKDSKKPDL
ncbi:hypothetical protein [Afifella pfennigii]|uniref:hypothetical protein n=1 Tax=Afifella pfennigii TaxID=209897 RepID=UPI00047BFDDE|nr:hypothetical protein [Afifella pfennigii]